MLNKITLKSDSNQARLIGQYAIDFIGGKYGPIAPEVLKRTELFFVDSLGCGIAAIGIGANAPKVLRKESLNYKNPRGAHIIASKEKVAPEKAILANCSAVRELDSNGTNFGYNKETGDNAGEFGHNDFYPVAIAAAEQKDLDGKKALLGMIALDEIRGRLAEVFSLKTYKIDHVVHGAIASAAVYGALMGADAEQIESAIGYVVAHHIPFRAIRAGHQLSDSKGASAAISTEAAITGTNRAMMGFVGPLDIFRNPQSIFRLFGKPFDLTLGTGGDYFAIMNMHLKLGLYEHQSASAIHALLGLAQKYPAIYENPGLIKKIRVVIYEPAYGIICDPAKWRPTTRQSADHSLPYILSALIRKANKLKKTGWACLMLMPSDYDEALLTNPDTIKLMDKVEIKHGGAEYDRLYPEGIPTSLAIEHEKLGTIETGLVKFPMGHANGPKEGLEDLIRQKFNKLAGLGVKDPESLWKKFANIEQKSSQEIKELFAFEME